MIVQKEPVSKDLEEAANNALNIVLNTHEIVNVRSCLEMFKFGAQWKEMQSTSELAENTHYKEEVEMKEVDLEKELDTWRHNHFHGRRDKEASGEYLERVSQLNLAKHFFELGMQQA